MPAKKTNLCGAMGQPELADDPRFKSNLDRTAHQDELYAIIDRWLLKHTREELREIGDRCSFVCGPVMNAKEICEFPHYWERGAVREVEDPYYGRMKVATMPPHFFRRIVQEIRRLGMKVTVHNCGDGPYFDAMIEQLQPDCISFSRLPDDCRDYAELKEKYGRQVALVGHVDCPHTLMFGSPQDVREECRRQIEGLARGGGFILASGCEVPPNAPLGNLRAMVEAAQTYGAYR